VFYNIKIEVPVNNLVLYCLPVKARTFAMGVARIRDHEGQPLLTSVCMVTQEAQKSRPMFAREAKLHKR